MKRQIPYEFGVTGTPFKPYDVNAKKAKRLEKLLQMDDADLIVKVCKHYINHFIPCPIENENEYWIISCFPATDNTPVRVSIWFPEVFNIHQPRHYYNYGDELNCMVFLHSDFLDESIMENVKQNVRGLTFRPGYRFVTGIPKQMAAFMPLSSYFDFVRDDTIYEGIRTHNYELTLKGRSPFKKGHNYGFVRYLFDH